MQQSKKITRDPTVHPPPSDPTQLGYIPNTQKATPPPPPQTFLLLTKIHIGLNCHIWRWERLDRGDQETSLLTLSHFITFFEFPTFLLQLLKRELLYPQITGKHQPDTVSSRRESTDSHGFTESAQMTPFRGSSPHLLSICHQGPIETMLRTHWTHQPGCCYSSSCVKTKADYTVK